MLNVLLPTLLSLFTSCSFRSNSAYSTSIWGPLLLRLVVLPSSVCCSHSKASSSSSLISISSSLNNITSLNWAISSVFTRMSDSLMSKP